MAENNYFDLEIISPDRVFFTGKAHMIELNTTEGQVGIYKRHIPMTMILEPGIVVIKDEEGERNAAIHTGFMEILPDKVSILAEEAEWPEEIDVKRANEAKIRAERRIQSKDPHINLARAEMALHKALIRIELADHVGDRK